jgi:hypothetical protein
MTFNHNVSFIAEEECNPRVVALLEIIQLQKEQIQALRDEIARLKGHKPKPEIKPSQMEKNSENKEKKSGRPGSTKRNKTGEIEIHDTVVLQAENIPEGSTFKGYENYTVQGLIFKSHNILYRRERWQTPDGKSIVAPLPHDVQTLDGGHFDGHLISYVIYQYHHAHVTQPLIREELLEIGIDISSGQINRIITENHDRFHREKDEILDAGLKVSGHLNVDDTSARHQGKNGYCTHIGNEGFAWFQSTASKSRINFLELLRAGHQDYVLGSEAMEYMRANQLPKIQLEGLAAHEQKTLANEAEWNAILAALNITQQRHVRIATEGALLGSILEHGFNPQMVILSDDAGQFNIPLLLHALCWIHAERTINKLVGCNDQQRTALEDIRTQIWGYYDELKAYKKTPSVEEKAALETRFDEIFTTQTCFATLNQALQRLHQNKSELLLVLDRPDIPLHNNTSERDIRDYVKKRKISGSTRSELGRRCRDTFASLKKTCRKLGIPFWKFLNDRIFGKGMIPSLAELIGLRADTLDSS